MLRGIAEFIDLPDAPFRIGVPGRQHGNHRRRFRQLIQYLIGENIISAQSLVFPDLGSCTHALAQHGLQSPLKYRNPPPLFRCERLVVNVSVTDENVSVEAHRF
jgi:hypothetical protein